VVTCDHIRALLVRNQSPPLRRRESGVLKGADSLPCPSAYAIRAPFGIPVPLMAEWAS
jgi:hypothetical protein